ncbi:MAG: hypothetical protein ACYSU0_15190 [Planctomycetota bacterium]
MSETEGDPVGPPRFPYVAAALCAACVGAAGWTWMRCSYAWNVTPDEIPQAEWTLSTEDKLVLARDMERLYGISEAGRYVELRGVFLQERGGCLRVGVTADGVGAVANVWAGQPHGQRVGAFKHINIKGRLYSPGSYGPGLLYEGQWVDATASRFTGESIAGLVVGAMGVFVLAVALRHWLGERAAR